ncbi:MAG: hypothetical protein IJ920_02190 [Paludibacteraceae bacterium]|nr:hypothetical protein [Paludibacteraceae bacterium]
MRNILNIIIICLVATVSANAQMATSRYAYGQTDAVVSPQSVTTTPRYSSPIYEPFSNSVPSDQTEVGAEQSSSHKGHIRRGFDTPDDPNQSNESPIGDALLPLIMALAVYCSVRVYRRRRRIR